MTVSREKPFYFNPPWNILFDFNRLNKISPWQVNVSFLLTSFLEEMEKRGEIDFRASGVALDSSAFIYLMKSKLLLKLEEPPAPRPVIKDIVPPPLFLPLRHELTSTTIEHLLQVLEEVIKGERLFVHKIKMEPILPQPSEVLPEIDRYLMEIQKQMENLYFRLKGVLREKRVIGFSEIVSKAERLEIIRTFILLLFLAQQGRINLWQEEEFGEIFITLAEENVIEGNGASF